MATPGRRTSAPAPGGDWRIAPGRARFGGAEVMQRPVSPRAQVRVSASAGSRWGRITQALITAQQFDLLMLSLADQQSIKGIFVVPGQVLNR